MIPLHFNNTAMFLLQRLKLSIIPNVLNGMSKMPYEEEGGSHGEPVISAISSNIHLQHVTSGFDDMHPINLHIKHKF